MANNKTAFWRFLGENKVMIPILQRDYAQGRSDKGALRKNFLASLKQALDGELPNGQNKLVLDFIYGSIEDGVMLPLDGQQRMTTLWLLHWFIALKAGKLAEGEATLLNFTYETRRSSREFCHQICLAKNFSSSESIAHLGEYITTRTWFSSSWLNDPTIQSMLRMISGTNINLEKIDKKKRMDAQEANNMIDGLEKLFKDVTAEKFKEYWDKITSKQPPFYFYQLPLQEFGLSDDLYVKMNARGKQLTPFENFKADLIGYIYQRAKEQDEDQFSDKVDFDKDWKKLLDPVTGIPILLDTDWTYIFWENRSPQHTLDEIFFAFLNRVFWEELVSGSNIDNLSGDDEKGAKELEGDPSYRYLTADNVNDYHDLSPYKFHKGEIPYRLFENLTIVMKRVKALASTNGMSLPRNIGETFHFLPEYTTEDSKKDVITRLTQPHRVLFHAVYKYLLEGVPETISLKRWLRVVCNITSGKSLGKDWNRYIIRTTATMLAAIRAISSLDSHAVYESLRTLQISNIEKEIPSRMNEEITKAGIIVDSDGKLASYPGTGYSTWEEAIIAAENYSFFNGSISFLYQGPDGVARFTDFSDKFNKAKEYFSPIVEHSAQILNENYGANTSLLQSLISRFDKNMFWNVIWWRKHYIFDNSEQSWRHYLYDSNLWRPVHEFLTEGLTTIVRTDSTDRAEHMLFLLTNTGLLDFALRKFGNSYIRQYHGHDAIYPSTTGVFLDTSYRDKFMQLPEIKMTSGERVPESSLIYGSDICFTYEGINFIWYRDNKVYLAKPDNGKEFQDLISEGKEIYFSINPNNKSYQELLAAMKSLPDKFENEKCVR